MFSNIGPFLVLVSGFIYVATNSSGKASCASVVEPSEDQLKEMQDEWFKDYEVDNSNNLTLKSFDDDIALKKVVGKLRFLGRWLNFVKKILREMMNDIVNLIVKYRPSGMLVILYASAIIVLTLFLIDIGIYCRTGYGCCCCAWLWRYPSCFFCDLKKTNRKLRQELFGSVPGLYFDSHVDRSITYEPSVKELKAFVEAVKKIRSLKR